MLPYRFSLEKAIIEVRIVITNMNDATGAAIKYSIILYRVWYLLTTGQPGSEDMFFQNMMSCDKQSLIVPRRCLPVLGLLIFHHPAFSLIPGPFLTGQRPHLQIHNPKNIL